MSILPPSLPRACNHLRQAPHWRPRGRLPFQPLLPALPLLFLVGAPVRALGRLLSRHRLVLTAAVTPGAATKENDASGGAPGFSLGKFQEFTPQGYELNSSVCDLLRNMGTKLTITSPMPMETLQKRQ
jgi:hypothetical protein